MYWQGLTDDELLRYADGNHEGQLEIARRVLAGDWRSGLEEQVAELEHDLNEARSEISNLEGREKHLGRDNATLTERIEALEAKIKTAQTALSA